MTIFDQIKADREAGSMSASTACAGEHVLSVAIQKYGADTVRADARRRGRVDQLERIALAAEDNDAMFKDIRDCLKLVLNRLRPGPDGEGQDEIDVIEAIISDCEAQMAKHAEACK